MDVGALLSCLVCCREVVVVVVVGDLGAPKADMNDKTVDARDRQLQPKRSGLQGLKPLDRPILKHSCFGDYV